MGLLCPDVVLAITIVIESASESLLKNDVGVSEPFKYGDAMGMSLPESSAGLSMF